MAKLNQILAVEKGTKSRVYSEVTTMNASAQKPALFNGFSKNWKPKDEDSEVFPPESSKSSSTTCRPSSRTCRRRRRSASQATGRGRPPSLCGLLATARRRHRAEAGHEVVARAWWPGYSTRSTFFLSVFSSL